MKQFRIAVIPGDGIGKEVMPEGLRVLEAAGRKFGVQWNFDERDWSCDYFEKHGHMMPEDGLDQLKGQGKKVAVLLVSNADGETRFVALSLQ